MPNDSSPQLKSLHSDWPAYVTFINRTSFPVDIVWIDFHGNLVRYCRGLEPGKCYHLNTYASHPWVAWNSHTLEKACIGGKFVFDPVAWQGEQQRTVVFIDRPMHSLLKLCIEKIRTLVSVEDVDTLEIPHHLFHKLKKRHKVEFREVQRRRR